MADKSRELRAFAPALVLLAICALINYVDRGNLSIAAPLLKDELRIYVRQLGILLSAFFWTYTAMQFVSGWAVDAFDGGWPSFDFLPTEILKLRLGAGPCFPIWE